VNRINIMAHYAAMTLVKPFGSLSHLSYYGQLSTYIRAYYDYSVFHSTLFVSTLSFYGNSYFQKIVELLTGRKAKGHEEMLDQVAMMSMRKFGLQVNEESFNA